MHSCATFLDRWVPLAKAQKRLTARYAAPPHWMADDSLRTIAIGRNKNAAVCAHISKVEDSANRCGQEEVCRQVALRRLCEDDML